MKSHLKFKFFFFFLSLKFHGAKKKKKKVQAFIFRFLLNLFGSTSKKKKNYKHYVTILHKSLPTGKLGVFERKSQKMKCIHKTSTTLREKTNYCNLAQKNNVSKSYKIYLCKHLFLGWLWFGKSQWQKMCTSFISFLYIE